MSSSQQAECADKEKGKETHVVEEEHGKHLSCEWKLDFLEMRGSTLSIFNQVHTEHDSHPLVAPGSYERLVLTGRRIQGGQYAVLCRFRSAATGAFSQEDVVTFYSLGT